MGCGSHRRMIIVSAFDVRCVCGLWASFCGENVVLICCIVKKKRVSLCCSTMDSRTATNPATLFCLGPKVWREVQGRSKSVYSSGLVASAALHTWISANLCWQFTCLLPWRWWSFVMYCRHSFLRCKHWRRWQLHLRWPGGRDTTLSLLQLRWQSSCNPGWNLQSVCCICIFFIQIFVSWRCVLFWLALSWFFLPNFGQYCHSLIITLDESSWF